MCVCVCVHKLDLALNNPQWLICHKTNQPTNRFSFCKQSKLWPFIYTNFIFVFLISVATEIGLMTSISCSLTLYTVLC